MSSISKPTLKLISLTFIALLLWLFSCFPNLVLTYYSSSLYLVISSILKNISAIVPFAIGDILYLLLIVWALCKVILFFKKSSSANRQILKITVVKLLHIGLVLYLGFKILWGLNYSRPSIANQLNIKKEKYTVSELVLLGNYFVTQLNQLKPKKRFKINLYY